MKVGITASSSFENINFMKLLPKETSQIISTAPLHLNLNILKYATSKGIDMSLYKKLDDIETIVNQCDYIVALWNGQNGLVHDIILYAESIKKPISVFELNSLLYTRNIDSLGRISLPQAIREKFNHKKEYLIATNGKQIVLTPYKKSCIFCGNTVNISDSVLPGEHNYICNNCLAALKDLNK